MTARKQTVRCRCPRGDVLAAVTLEGEHIIAMEDLVARFRESIALGRFGTVCGQCSAPRASWVIEIGAPLEVPP